MIEAHKLNAAFKFLNGFLDTGVGKSTTIQLLTGAKMVTMDGHIQADPEEIETNPVLKNIVSAKSTQSVTRYCQ